MARQAAAVSACRDTAPLAVLGGILAVAFNLRIGIVSVGPLIEDIRSSAAMSSTVAGLLGAVPFLCMGVFALGGPPLAARIGSERLIAYALALLAAGTLLRAAAPSAALIVLATVPMGIAVALMGLTLPGVVKRCFPGRPGAITGSYVAALAVGAAITALLMVPLAHALGGWRAAFAVSAAPALLALPLWLRAWPAFPAPRAGGRSRPSPRRRPGRSELRLGLMFGLQSMGFAAVISWVAALYRHHGWSAGHAALTIAMVSIFTAPASLLVPRLSDGRDRRPWLLGTASLMAAAVLGLALAPMAAPWLWVIAFGIGTGSIFPLMLTLPLDLRDSQAQIDELTGWMLGIGYAMSAFAPLLVGAGRDLTGGFELPLVLMSAAGFGTGLLGLSRRLAPRQQPLVVGSPSRISPTATAAGPRRREL